MSHVRRSFFIIKVMCVLFLTLFSRSESLAAALEIKQNAKAFVAHSVYLEAVGDVAASSDVSLEWAFSENVRALVMKDSGRACTFSVFEITSVAVRVKAYSKEHKLIAEAHSLVEILPVDVEIIPVSQDFVLLWDSEKKLDIKGGGIAQSDDIFLKASISPDVVGTNFRWKISPECSNDISDDSSILSFMTGRTGIFAIDVEAFDSDGIFLGKGSRSVDVVVSGEMIQLSDRRRSAWKIYEEAVSVWNAAGFSNYDEFGKALNLMNKAYELDNETHEISEAAEKMANDNLLILRAVKFSSEGNDFKERQKWAESLSAYRGALAAWRFSEIEDNMAEVEKIVLEIRVRRDRASWLRAMAKAYENEGKYQEAIDSYKKSLEFDIQSEAYKGIERMEEAKKKASNEGKIQKKIAAPSEADIEKIRYEAEQLAKEGHELYRTGKYNEALELYKKSFAMKNDPELAKWIARVESGIKAQNSIDEANRLIREANALYKIQQYKEALERYKASLELYPNDDVSRYVKHIEEIMLKSGN